MCHQIIAGLYVSIWGSSAFLKGTSAVSWHLLLLPQHLPSFVYTGACTENPFFLSPVHYRLSLLYIIQIKSRYGEIQHDCLTFIKKNDYHKQ